MSTYDMCTYIHTYIYMEGGKEGARERGSQRERESESRSPAFLIASLYSALYQEPRWPLALQLFPSITKIGLSPNVHSYNALLHSYESGMQLGSC